MSRFDEVDYSSLTYTMRGLLHQGNEIWRSAAINAQHVLEDLLSYRSLDDVAASVSQRPLLAVFVIAMVLSCGIPVLLFTLFACLTVLLTFTGFLVIEGTILTIGSVVLCGFILAMLIVMLSMTAAIALAYFGCTEMFGLIKANSKQPDKTFYHNEQFEGRSRSLTEPIQVHED